ncbi:MAG TPA: 16S rRNA (guanine(527)-N(7))-methyltransferase RsmG [Actinomycetota bacterium]|nr:16S rRNA (guanine(527)-N(7))-methyltransferase RsmG [Actinomycetota bacterium]
MDNATPDDAQRLAQFVQLLADWAIPLGFMGPREEPKLLDRHIAESAALLEHVADGPVVDVGSGAGLPGIVIAIWRREGVLLEAERRRAEFLRRVVSELSLGWHVVADRAEAVGRDEATRSTFTTAVARALAPPAVALELLMPLVKVGGRAVLMAGPSALEDPNLAWVAHELGGETPQTVRLQVTGGPGPAWAIIVDKSSDTPDRYPRRTGVPLRRPLRKPSLGA